MKKSAPTLILLRERFPWMGKYSGYDKVFESIEKLNSFRTQSVFRDFRNPLPTGTNTLFESLAKQIGPSSFYTKHSVFTEIKVVLKSLHRKHCMIHVAYADNNLGILGQFGRYLPAKIIGTIHQPASWWEKNGFNPNTFAGLDALIVLSKNELAFFENYLPGRVHYIPHGIDTDFFRPPTSVFLNKMSRSAPRCVFSGFWLRDLETLAEVVNIVCAKDKDVVFDMIVPFHQRCNSAFEKIAHQNRLNWHGDMTDEQLRQVYWNANLMILPMIDCTANNALLEAMACGLPVVSNRVGGIPDYTDESFAELLPVGDAIGMAEAILRNLVNSSEREQKCSSASNFANSLFSWYLIAPQIASLYLKLMPPS